MITAMSTKQADSDSSGKSELGKESGMMSTLCKMCIWWRCLDASSKLSMDAAHEMANIQTEIVGHCLFSGKGATLCPDGTLAGER